MQFCYSSIVIVDKGDKKRKLKVLHNKDIFKGELASYK
jgi:hypothetical protein